MPLVTDLNEGKSKETTGSLPNIHSNGKKRYLSYLVKCFDAIFQVYGNLHSLQTHAEVIMETPKCAV